MNTFFINNPQLVWPLTLLFAWIFGEIGTYIIKIPKITFYILFGFIFASHQIGPIQTLDSSGMLFLMPIRDKEITISVNKKVHMLMY